jgi:hypothetical protein
MKKNAKLMAIIFSVFLIGVIGYGVSFPTRITTYSGSSHAGCHGTNSPGSGTLTVTPSVSGRVINLTVSITGFTEAVTPPYHGTVSVGLPYAHGDNELFGHGIEMNNVHGHDDYWATTIWEENLTAGGNTMHNYKFQVIAPAAAGTYDLIVVALTGWNATSDSEAPLYRLETTLTVTVTGNTATVTSLVTTLPLANFFGIILIGLVTLIPVALILIRKRK